jgi:tetratricopeptide (TPR) repeat protein
VKKELRDEIKQDEFASGLEQAASWAARHAKELRIGLGVALVLVAIIGGVAYYRGQQGQESDRALRDALTTWEAPLASETPAGMERPAGPTFATPEEKYQAAAKAFDAVAQKYGSSAAGLRARYYAALSRIELGKYDEAEKALREIQSRGKSLEAELARAGIADVYRRSGQVDKAVEAYKGLATNPTASLPRDFALLSAARTLEDAKRLPEARATYRQLFEEFPASVYAAEARTRVEYLETAVQG